MDLVSIIIPVYNVENYIDECIQSVIAQSYKEVEIWLIDDGSTDTSGKKCDLWKEKDSRIHVIHQANQGLSGARNTGLDSCTGDWISFIDSDDFVATDYVKKMVDIAHNCGVDLVQCRETVELHRIKKESNEDIVNHWKGTPKEFLLSNEYRTMAWAKLYRKHLFNTLRFPVGKLHEDNAIVYKLVYNSDKVAYTEEMLYGYRLRDQSITVYDGYNLKQLDKQEFLEEQISFFQEHDEVELLQKAYKEYAFELLENYGKVAKYHNDRKELLQDIKQKYCKVATQAMKDSRLSEKTRLLMQVARWNPIIWTKVFGEK